MKLASEMFRVDATRPPTLTEARSPNRTPLGLTRKILPLADRLPKMPEGSGPSTRLRATELLPGWTKRTASVGAMPKLCQLSTALPVDCVIVVNAPLVTMPALPAATTPPVGAADTPAPKQSINETASARYADGAPL